MFTFWARIRELLGELTLLPRCAHFLFTFWERIREFLCGLTFFFAFNRAKKKKKKVSHYMTIGDQSPSGRFIVEVATFIQGLKLQ